jgi:hypothetical protein
LIAQAKPPPTFATRWAITITFDTYGHLFSGRGKEASARYEKSMADASLRHNTEAGVSNPLAIDGEEGPEGTVTN